MRKVVFGNCLQLLGVVLSLTSVPMFAPKELMISEILCHSSFSSNGDKMDKFCDSLPVECRWECSRNIKVGIYAVVKMCNWAWMFYTIGRYIMHENLYLKRLLS